MERTSSVAFNPNEPARILITGAAGFIGGSLARYLLQRYPNTYLILVDNLVTGFRKNLPDTDPDRWVFQQVDVNVWEEIAPVFEQYSPDFVFHCAALTGVQRTLEAPLEVLRDVRGIENVAQLCIKAGVRRVFFTSSSEVYGEPVSVPLHEERSPLNARLPYAAVKVLGEVIFQAYWESHQLPYTIFRLFNTYGPLQRPDFVVSIFLKHALLGKPLPVYGDGSQTRTFCFIQDTLDFFACCLEREETALQIYNVGNDEEITIRELAELVREVTGKQVPIAHLPPRRRGDVRRRKPDNSRMKSLLQRELTSLRKGLQIILETWMQNPHLAPEPLPLS